MRLAEFIVSNSQKIISEFESFARSVDPAGSMDVEALRDHAAEMLVVIARDLDTPQTQREGSDKSKGQSDSDASTADTPAQEHGSGRAVSGFTVAQMVSEYRALRASVTRLWIEEMGELKAADLQDLIRFNEAIDQALAESTGSFTGNLEETRETFLGILGHDLRTPLGAIITAGQFMVEMPDLPAVARTLVGRMLSSGLRMNQMVDDLLDFTRTRLGVSIPIERTHVDLKTILEDAVEEMKAARPHTIVILETSGDLQGDWDGARLSQVMSNLISNAISHGLAGTQVTIKARAEADQVTFSVHNYGPPIPRGQFDQIFMPLSRSSTASREADHFGLGLYIADQIVNAHAGTIKVESSEAEGTTFTVCLPRHA